MEFGVWCLVAGVWWLVFGGLCLVACVWWLVFGGWIEVTSRSLVWGVLTIERGSGSETALKFSGDALYSLPCHTFFIFYLFFYYFYYYFNVRFLTV